MLSASRTSLWNKKWFSTTCSIKPPLKYTFKPNIKSNHIDVIKYHNLTDKLRKFFMNKGWIEVNTQYRTSILAACEDPWTIASFDFKGEEWPLPQTGQMWLEQDLLNNPDLPGVFTVSTSYRAEPNPIPGRHQTIFPMFEFEGKGDMWELRTTLEQIFEYLDFKNKGKRYHSMNYHLACDTYNVDSIEAAQEELICRDKGSIVFLERFPESTFPFWNMKIVKGSIEKNNKWVPYKYANKIDALVYGQETIGCAERETDKDVMRENFETISEGKYAKKLYELFTEERVKQELEDFLSMNFFPRYGGGIGLHRLIRGMDLEEESKEFESECKKVTFCHIP